MSRRPKPPPPGTRPRTFEEVRAANLKDAFHAARLARLDSGESFDGVSVHPDCEGGSHWIVEWLDSDGGCYVTTFDGPLAERGARLLRRPQSRTAAGAQSMTRQLILKRAPIGESYCQMLVTDGIRRQRLELAT
jgi:hypothetical protein